MRRPSRTDLSWLFVLVANLPSTAQNLHAIGSEKPFSFSGGISFNQVFHTSGGASGRDPYSLYGSGNINLALYGWNVPLGFSISRSRTSISQPFNRYSLHPSWKWISAHAGHTAISFSPYTVNGHIFLGGAIDLTPGNKWKVSALYGRFLKAVNPATADVPSAVPSFERRGYGLKAAYGKGRDFIELILFRANDDESSLPPLPDSLGITPAQNLVVSLGGGKSLFTHLLLKAELATSALTKDTRAHVARNDHPLAKVPVLFQPRRSSAYYQAIKTTLDYQNSGWNIGLAYERIDPEYRTLGAYYFNNDLENITVNVSGGLLQGKMNFAASTGVQRDNLQKNKISTMRRRVGSFNLSYTPSQKLNLSSSWSDFQTHTNIRSPFEALHQLTPYDNLDTLTFTQISRNASLSGLFALPQADNKKSRTITVHLTWQEAGERQGQAQHHSGTDFYNLTLGYATTLIAQNMSLAATFNTTINEGPLIKTRMMGPSVSASRSFYRRKLRTTFSSAWYNTTSNGEKRTAVVNARLNGALSITNKHNISVSAVMAGRSKRKEIPGTSSLEFTATVGYSYSFSGGKGKSGKTKNTKPVRTHKP